MKKALLLASLAVLAPALLMAYPAVGDTAPNFTLPDTALVGHSLTEYQGKVVLLQFWDSGSETCRAELPGIQSMWDDYGSQGFQPMCIDLEEPMSVVKTFADSFSQLFLLDSTDAVWNLYNIGSGIPLNYVIDTSGIVVYEAVGYNDQVIRNEIELYVWKTGIHEGKVAKPLSAVSVAPNPTTDRVLISFSLAKAGNASVRIYSSNGELVRAVLNRTASAGNSSVAWDLRDNAGRRVTVGTYFYEVKAGSVVAHGKISVLN